MQLHLKECFRLQPTRSIPKANQKPCSKSKSQKVISYNSIVFWIRNFKFCCLRFATPVSNVSAFLVTLPHPYQHENTYFHYGSKNLVQHPSPMKPKWTQRLLLSETHNPTFCFLSSSAYSTVSL